MIADTAEPILAHALQSTFAAAVRRARSQARPIIVSYTCALPTPVDPVAFFARGGRRHAHRTFWEQPAKDLALVGVGAARVIRTSGEGRFRDAAALIGEDMATAFVDGDGLNGGRNGPVYLGGFAFDPQRPSSPDWRGYPDGLVVLPRILLDVRAGEASVTLSAVVAPDADPAVEVAAAWHELESLYAPEPPLDSVSRDPARVLGRTETLDPETWKATVAAAAADVRGGRFEKVVLARELRITGVDMFDPESALRRLRTANPSATVFAVATSDKCFLGATPELLVRLADGEVEAVCLAGSVARGATEPEEKQLAQALLESAKDRTEHEVVVRSTQEVLATVCDRVVRAPTTPWVVRSESVQHLATPLWCHLAGEGSVLDLVERLHPTPAVGGFPRDVALAAIREREGIDRGWYAGPVGWVNRAGDGEFAVAIRSALISGRVASLYAGCGIVADSDPEAEYAETCLKLKPMLAALGVS